jgi:hypothetical protein
MLRKSILAVIALFGFIASNAQQTDVDNGYEKGKIEDGYKVGIWEYFGFDKSIELKIDYDKRAIAYLKPDTSKYFVMQDSVWSFKSLNSYPRYIGSYNEFYLILGKNLKYPVEARMKKIEKTVFLEFDVNQQGQAAIVKIINDDERYFTANIIAVFNLIPNLWLSANYNGQTVPAKFILPFYYKLTGGKKSLPYDIDKLNDLEGSKMSKITITAPRP